MAVRYDRVNFRFWFPRSIFSPFPSTETVTNTSVTCFGGGRCGRASLTGVRAHVRAQVDRLQKAAAAHCALERHVAAVRRQVAPQAARLAELPAAGVAAVGSEVGVSRLVLSQRHLAGEADTAKVAPERLETCNTQSHARGVAKTRGVLNWFNCRCA